MSIDIHCNLFDVGCIDYFGNEWIVGNKTGFTLSNNQIIDNLSMYYHNKFNEYCEEDLRKRNKNERKEMTLDRYIELGFHSQFEWWEQKSKDVLLLKDNPDVEFYLL